MKDPETLARALIEANNLESDSDFVAEITRALVNRFAKPILPDKNQTVAVGGGSFKAAALFFDRVWYSPAFNDQPPKDIAVYGATDTEIWPFATLLIGEIDMKSVVKKNDAVWQRFARAGRVELAIAQAISDEHGIDSVPMYQTYARLNEEFPRGENSTLLASISNLQIVDDSKLDWKQVAEVRSDKEATTKLRRLRNWIRTEHAHATVPELTDALATRLDDYEWAIKKHGIQTALGAISDLVDPKFLAGAGVTLAGLVAGGATTLAALAGTGILIGRATVSVVQKSIDFRDVQRGNKSEIAFVHDLKKLNR